MTRCPMIPQLLTVGLILLETLAGSPAASDEAPRRIVLIDQQTKDLSAWGEPGQWVVVGQTMTDPKDPAKLATEPGQGVLVNGPGRTSNLLSKAEHGDVRAHVEFMVPEGSNSGIYFQGRYEIQVLDSWGVKELKHGDCGGIYERYDEAAGVGREGHPPWVNASRQPGQWQSFDVTFRAPRFDASGKKTANARFIEVALNGERIHENVEVTGPTRAATFEDEKPTGPLMLQGDHGPVAYRNLWLEPLSDGLPPSERVRPELYATGFEFAEGPALDGAGNLFVVNYRGNGNIGRITPDGAASVFCNLRELAPLADRKPQANGLKVDRQGRVLAADAGGGRLLRISADGKKVEVLADRFEEKRFNAINDVALDLAGNVYFTDPGNSNAERPTGSFYRLDAATGKLSRLGTGLAYPNGIGLTPDQKRLCLSESERHRMLLFDLSPEGTVSNQRVLTDFEHPQPPEIPAGPFVPDGLIFDESGRLYVGMWTAGIINVIDPATGQILRQYDAGGKQATNCHFHGGYLYTTVAAKEGVFRLKLGVEGFDYRGK